MSILLASIVLLFFFLILFILAICVHYGRKFGRKQLEKSNAKKLEVLTVAESAVFGLLGLLVAFTFAGAYDRYEHRKLHILHEADAFSAAYEYADLVPAKFQPALHSEIQRYLDMYIQMYRDIPNMYQVRQDYIASLKVQHDIWKTTIDASANNTALAQLIIPAMKEMFDTAHDGINLTRLHPPGIIFLLLIGLAALGAYLVGYTSAENSQKNSIHIWSYVLLTAFTIYVILNLEFPRIGFIRFNSFDEILVDARQNMK